MLGGGGAVSYERGSSATAALTRERARRQGVGDEGGEGTGQGAAQSDSDSEEGEAEEGEEVVELGGDGVERGLGIVGLATKDRSDICGPNYRSNHRCLPDGCGSLRSASC